ncbi:hypothetical protein BCR42DRAFT_429093 [Absidia repens]|uniref:peptidylprolyl isomerase n=1 Tax=Absidia repens TaxID=90262 RepID=A0A1X2HXE7_9FUNG|nr:hypothetical protein BCR42DRAFT_429093 [Absidia repens]
MSSLNILRHILLVVALLFVFVQTSHAIDDGEPPVGNVLGRTLHKPIKCDKKVATNARIKLHYTARQWNKEEFFEDTYKSGTPLSYKLGSDKLMKGLEQGIKNMCEHESRRLLIPADLAYGELGLPGLVDPDAAIIMEVEMLEVNSPFRNPWFWAGLIVLVAAFVVLRKQAQLENQSKVAAFIERKEQ